MGDGDGSTSLPSAVGAVGGQVVAPSAEVLGCGIQYRRHEVGHQALSPSLLPSPLQQPKALCWQPLTDLVGLLLRHSLGLRPALALSADARWW